MQTIIYTDDNMTMTVEKSLGGWRARWFKPGTAQNHWASRLGGFLPTVNMGEVWADGLFASKDEAETAIWAAVVW
jgi:hypothetical protein